MYQTIPATLSNDQTNAYHFIHDFLNNRYITAVLAGYAGTGKTTIVSKFVEEHKHFLLFNLVAPTHQALDQLRERIPKNENVGFSTLASKTDIRVFRNQDYELIFSRHPSDRKNPDDYNLVIVDECSMINDEDFNYLVNNTKTKILFLGDPLQIPPIKGGRLSQSFNVPFRMTLTNIIRQALDNPIVNLSLKVRESLQLNGSVILPDLKSCVTFDNRFMCIPYSKIYDFASTIYREGLLAPILAFDNDSVDQHNKFLHNALYPDYELYAPDERVMIDESFEYETGDLINNGEIFKVISCRPIDPIVGVRTYELISERSDGQIFHFKIPFDKEELKQVKFRLKSEKDVVKAKKPRNESEYQEIIALDKALYNKQVSLSVFAPIRHCYSMTIHKSQGSTFEGVIFDWTSITKIPVKYREYRLVYTAITRPSGYLLIAC